MQGAERTEDLRLLMTELVTHSVRHGSRESLTPIELSLVAAPHHVRAEVADSGPGFTAAARGEGDDEGSGWGLHLVGRLSDRWGVERNGRCVVWVELEAEFEPEWWLSETSDYVESAPARSGAAPREAERPTTALRSLRSVWSVARSQEPEAEVD